MNIDAFVRNWDIALSEGNPVACFDLVSKIDEDDLSKLEDGISTEFGNDSAKIFMDAYRSQYERFRGNKESIIRRIKAYGAHSMKAESKMKKKITKNQKLNLLRKMIREEINNLSKF